MEKFSRENTILGFTLGESLIFLTLISPMLVRFNFSEDPSLIVYFSLFLSFFSFFLSWTYYFFLNREEKKSIKNKNKKLLYYCFVVVFVVFVVEIVNFNTIKDFKLPLVFLINILTLVFSSILFLREDRLQVFLHNSLKIYASLVLVSIYFSLFSIFLSKKIVWINDQKYLITPYILNIQMRQHLIGRGLSGRYAGLFRNVNQLGEFSYLLFVFSFFADGVSKQKKYFVWSIIALFLSKSRNAILSVIVFLFFYICIHYFTKEKIKNKEKYQKIIKTVIVTGLLIFSVFSFIIYYKIDDIALANGRVTLWKTSLFYFKNNPFTGIGMKGFRQKILPLGASSHNSFYQLLGSGGLMYFSLYIHFIYTFLKELYSNQYFDLLFSFIVSSMFYQMFENILLESHFHFNVLILLSLIILIFRNDSEPISR